MFSCSEFNASNLLRLIFTKFSCKTLKADISHKCDNPFLEASRFPPCSEEDSPFRATEFFTQSCFPVFLC